MTFILPPPSIKKWTLESSARVGHYRVFDVYSHAVRDGGGRKRRDVFTFVCPEWCNVIAVTPDEEIVMVWQYRFGTDALSLEVPAGLVDPGESPMEAARRELREESGYEAASLEPLLVVEANPALQNNRCHTFVARDARLTAATSFDENEELEAVLVPVSALADVLDAGHVTHALVRAPLEVFLRKRAARQTP